MPSWMDDGSNAPRPKDTERDLLAKIADVLAGGGGGGGGGGFAQMYQYLTTDPTTDGIVPVVQNSPALAYKFDGTGPTYTWNTTTHVWQ